MGRYTTLVALAFVAAGCASGGTGGPSAAVPISDVSAFAGHYSVKDGKARYETTAGRPAGIFIVPSGTLALSQRGGKKVLDGTSDDGKVKFQFTTLD